MEYATRDNKNKFVFTFWSLFVAKKIFHEVYVSFLLVGHTHDDIDALFGRWSMQLKKDNFPTIPSLMKSFMDIDLVPTIPHFIEDVPNFKSFTKGLICEGKDALVNHIKAQQFKFYLNATSFSIMKYKHYCTDNNWLLEEGIKLWKEDSEGRSLWPRGEPLLVVHLPMRSVDDVYKGLSGFIKYRETLYNEDRSGEYRRCFKHLVFY